MSHEEWVLHQNFEYVEQLLNYVETRVCPDNYRDGEYLHDALVELGKHIRLELDKVHN